MDSIDLAGLGSNNATHSSVLRARTYKMGEEIFHATIKRDVVCSKRALDRIAISQRMY